MKLVENLSEIGEWIRLFDKIHISLDIDFFDPSIVSAVNTPVSHGKSFDDFKQILQLVTDEKKLLSIDIVEFNPTVTSVHDISSLTMFIDDVVNFIGDHEYLENHKPQ